MQESISSMIYGLRYSIHRQATESKLSHKYQRTAHLISLHIHKWEIFLGTRVVKKITQIPAEAPIMREFLIGTVLYQTKSIDGTEPNTKPKTSPNPNTNPSQLFYAFLSTVP